MNYVTNLIVAGGVLVGIVLGFAMGMMKKDLVAQVPTAVAVQLAPAPVKTTETKPAAKGAPTRKAAAKAVVPSKRKQRARARSRRPVVQQASIGSPAPFLPPVEPVMPTEPAPVAQVDLAAQEPVPSLASGGRGNLDGDIGNSAPAYEIDPDAGHFGVKETNETDIPKRKNVDSKQIQFND